MVYRMLLYYCRTGNRLKAQTSSDLPKTMQSDNGRNGARTRPLHFESNVLFTGHSLTSVLAGLFGTQFVPLSIPLKEG